MENIRNLDDLCDTCLYSDSVGDRVREFQQYLVEFLSHPDKGSEFDRRNRILKYLFQSQTIAKYATTFLLDHLLSRGYDVLFLESNQEIIGHCAFQVHGDNTLHAFSTYIHPDYRRRGFGTYLQTKIIDVARDKDIALIRLGRGKLPDAPKVFKYLSEHSKRLGVAVQERGWISIH